MNTAENINIIEKRLERVRANLSNHPHKVLDWDKEVDKYIASVEKMRSIVKSRDFAKHQNTDLVKKMNSFMDECESAEFDIAFVGTIKTGKSTLINAILGGDYASMSVTPETAALSKFKYSENDYVNVKFYTKAEWSQLWESISTNADAFKEEYKQLGAAKVKDKWVGHAPIHKELRNEDIKEELKKWSSSQSPEHYFVKEIEIGISTLPENFPRRVVFVDTPGLSDPVQYRSDITKNYIQNANAVMVCVNAQSLDKEAISIITSAFSIASDNKKNVYVIATHWDAIPNPIDENWDKLYKNLKTQLVGSHAFPNERIAGDNIMYSSAYIYDLFKHYDTIESSGKKEANSFYMKYVCDDDDIEKAFAQLYKIKDINERKKIMQVTNIDNIRNVISDRIVSNYSINLRNRLTAKYNMLMNAVDRYAKEMLTHFNQSIENEEKSLKELVKQKKILEKQKKDLEKYSTQIASVLKQVEGYSDKRLNFVLRGFDK